MTMHTFPVLGSSNLRAVAHDGTSLFVSFHNGSTYRYEAGPELFGQIITAPSAGKAFHQLVRAPGLPCSRLAPEQIEALWGDLDPQQAPVGTGAAEDVA